MFNTVFRPFNEFPITRANGTTVNCEGDSALVLWHQRPVLQLNVRDVSERKKVGQQLRRAEKLSALGQLIAGVAHELNNRSLSSWAVRRLSPKEAAWMKDREGHPSNSSRKRTRFQDCP